MAAAKTTLRNFVMTVAIGVVLVLVGFVGAMTFAQHEAKLAMKNYCTEFRVGEDFRLKTFKDEAAKRRYSIHADTGWEMPDFAEGTISVMRRLPFSGGSFCYVDVRDGKVAGTRLSNGD